MKRRMKFLALSMSVLLLLSVFMGAFALAEEDASSEPDTSASDDTATGGDTSDGDTPDGEPADGENGDEDGEDDVVKEINGIPILATDQMTKVESENVLGILSEYTASAGDVLVRSARPSEDFALQATPTLLGVYYIEDASKAVPIEPSAQDDYNIYRVGGEEYGEIFVVHVLANSEIDPNSLTRAEYIDWKLSHRGKFASPEQRVRYMTEICNVNGRILYADEELAEIAIYDTKTNDYYFSSPYNYGMSMGSDQIKSQMASLVQVMFYDSQSKPTTYTSFTDAVKKVVTTEDGKTTQQFTTEKIENGVRFNFQIGKLQTETTLPYAAEATRFEEKVIKVLEEKSKTSTEAAFALRKVKAYWTKYTYSELSSSQKESLLVNYPGLEKVDMYVLRPVGEREQKMLTEYIEMTDYTWDDYLSDKEVSGYVSKESAVALFSFPLDITLDSNGDMIVDLPANEITYDTSEFTLFRITLMQYFGAAKSTQDGWMFVPDGSGTIVNFNKEKTKTSLNTIRRVYGDDYALANTTEYLNLTQSCYMPVYGLHSREAGFLAIIEKGEAMARIISESGNVQSDFEAVYSDFVYATVQTMEYSDGVKANGSWTYYNKNYYKDSYRIRYKLFHGEDVTYVTMAKAYQQYLIDNGVLTDTLKINNEATPFYLETLGLIDKTASFLGIVYNKKIPMTEFSDAQNMIEALQGAGITNVSLRYRGWMNGGLNYSVPSKLKVESKLGGKSGLKELVGFMKDQNLCLFPEVDFAVVRRDGFFDGYSTLSNSPKTLDKKTLTLTPATEIHNILEIVNNYFAIAPKSSKQYFQKFFDKYEEFDVGSVSLGTMGSMLYSDFSSDEKGTHRQQAQEIIVQNLADNAERMGRLMVEGGNAYTYQYATDIVDIPLSDSTNILSDESIPFMQIVLHGYKQYAGEAMNLADDMKLAVLKSAEYGANLHFTLSAKDTGELKDTVYSHYFTVDFDTWKQDAIDLYKKFDAVFADLQDQPIVGHEQVKIEEDDQVQTQTGIYITTYANGTKIVVNYNDTEAEVNGKKIAAKDFAVL